MPWVVAMTVARYLSAASCALASDLTAAAVKQSAAPLTSGRMKVRQNRHLFIRSVLPANFSGTKVGSGNGLGLQHVDAAAESLGTSGPVVSY